MLVEVVDDAAIEWTRPDEFPADTKDPLSKLVGLRAGGFLSVFADAAPHFISKEISPEMLENLFGREDRRAFNQADWDRWIDFVSPSAVQTEPGKSATPAKPSASENRRDAKGDNLSHVVHFELGRTQLPEGDKIIIDEVRGTSETMTAGNMYEVKGTYTLNSADKAMLAAYTTVNANDPNNPKFQNVPDLKTQTVTVEKGQGHFTLLFYMWQDGCPHVSFYPAKGGGDIGGVYFGTGSSVYK